MPMKDREKGRLVANFEKQGARVKPTRSGWQVFTETGSFALHRSESSDRKGDLALRKQAERAGLVWPEGGV